MSYSALQLDTYFQYDTRHSCIHPCNGHQSHSQSNDSYLPRSPRSSAHYKLVEDNYDRLERVWEYRYQHMYGYWRPHILDVIYKYLDCGDPHLGFARIKCTLAGRRHSLLLAHATWAGRRHSLLLAHATCLPVW